MNWRHLFKFIGHLPRDDIVEPYLFGSFARPGGVMKMLPVITGLIALAIALSPVRSAFAAEAPRATEIKPLLAKVKISYERFTLANGLRVIVHTDRKAPVVAVSVWYDIGSKQEPKEFR